MTRGAIGEFFGRVKVFKDGCWLSNVVGSHGYGLFRDALAHRVAYEWFVGKIPSGLHVDHLCRVRSCVNPAHLEAVTLAENNRRAKGLQYQETCKRGHALAPDNIRYSRRPDGARQQLCATCKLNRQRRRYAELHPIQKRVRKPAHV